VAAGLTSILEGVPNLVLQMVARPHVGPNPLAEWIRTGSSAGEAIAPQASRHPLELPPELLTLVVLALVPHVTLTRLMIGAAVGEGVGWRSALASGFGRLETAIGTGLCAILIFVAVGIPTGIVSIALVEAHAWP
jgi:hypothetical protein